jgi:hypothetical protein
VPNGKPLAAKSIGIALARRKVTCLGTDSGYGLTAVILLGFVLSAFPDVIVDHTGSVK